MRAVPATATAIALSLTTGGVALVAPTPAVADPPAPHSCHAVSGSNYGTGPYVVPAGVSRLWVEVTGQGGDPSSLDPYTAGRGLAARVSGWLPVSAGDRVITGSVTGSLFTLVDGSDTELDGVIVMAGSGGMPGTYWDGTALQTSVGGDAGLPGGAGSSGSGNGGGGSATETAGGAGGVFLGATAGQPGSSWNDPAGSGGASAPGGGEGGSGYFFGGGGAGSVGTEPGGGGGGGSSYVGAGFEQVSAELVTSSSPTSLMWACSTEPDPNDPILQQLVSLGYTCAAPARFGYTGQPESFTVPASAEVAVLDAYGASGGGALGGHGGRVTSVIGVTPGEELQIRVGGVGVKDFITEVPGGYNGGGSARLEFTDSPLVASGGGASDVRRAPFGLSDRLAVGGGGGGSDDVLSGGDGGQTGGDGQVPTLTNPTPDQLVGLANLAGTGGTASGPGANGRIFQGAAGEEATIVDPANAPGAGQGGRFKIDAAALPSTVDYPHATAALGGGGGWFGGGAGGAYYRSWDQNGPQSVELIGAAGGGSSHAVAAPAGLPAAQFQDGARWGDGLVRITTCLKPTTTPSPSPSASATGTPDPTPTASPSATSPQPTPAPSTTAQTDDDLATTGTDPAPWLWWGLGFALVGAALLATGRLLYIRR